MIAPGTPVRYAGCVYEVKRVHGDLIDLIGLAEVTEVSASGLDGRGIYMKPVTVLASDVTVLDGEAAS